MKKIFCIGEVLIDFVAENQGSDLAKANVFTKKAGGAPANVAVAVAKLGGNSAFIGCVGDDPFGSFLLDILASNKVDISHTQRVSSFTSLAFVSLAEDGERDFFFGRGADKELAYDLALKEELHDNIMHFGAATALLGGSLEKAYGRYLFDALTQHTFISFDPNFRGDLWKENEALFIQKCTPYIEKSHLCKFSLEEAQLLSGKTNLEEISAALHALGVPIITITLGNKGTFVSSPSGQKTIPTITVSPIDTTGAGDAFIGCLLHQIAMLDDPLQLLKNDAGLEAMIIKANTAGAITTTGFGAIDALPTQDQIFGA